MKSRSGRTQNCPWLEDVGEKQWPQLCNEVECQGDDKTGDKLCQRRDKVNKFRGWR
jgi:hypothetical protein